MLTLLRTHLRYAVLFSTLVNLLSLVPTLYMLQVYDRVLSSRSIETLSMLLVFTAIALSTWLLVECARSKLLAHASVQLDKALGGPAVLGLLEKRAQAQVGTTTADHGLRDLASLRTFVSSGAVVAFLDAPWAVVYLALIFAFHWMLGAVALVAAAVLLVFAYLNNRFTHERVKSYETKQATLETFTTQLARNAEIIAALGMGPRVVQQWQAKKEIVLQEQSAVLERSGNYKSFGKTIRQFIQAVMMGVGVWLVINAYATPGVMLATTVLLGKALAPVEQIIGLWKQIVELRIAWPRLQALATAPTPQPFALPAPVGALSVEHLTYRLPATGDTGDRPLLHDLTFQVAAGQMLTITGASGCGKSTLMRCLLGLLPLSSGAVRLDGSDIGQWPRERLGAHVGYVPQDVELFAGTVADNISRSASPAPGVTEAVVKAAQRAHVHDMILRLPKGYDTPIGESGRALSGGQRQRIALARAIYGEPRLLLLDEPNAHLDAEGEAALGKTLAFLKRNRVTIVAITHRPGLTALSDTMLALRDGHIEPLGRPRSGPKTANGATETSVVPIRALV